MKAVAVVKKRMKTEKTVKISFLWFSASVLSLRWSLPFLSFFALFLLKRWPLIKKENRFDFSNFILMDSCCKIWEKKNLCSKWYDLMEVLLKEVNKTSPIYVLNEMSANQHICEGFWWLRACNGPNGDAKSMRWLLRVIFVGQNNLLKYRSAPACTYSRVAKPKCSFMSHICASFFLLKSTSWGGQGHYLTMHWLESVEI